LALASVGLGLGTHHIADVVEVLAAGANGELGEIGLRFGVVAGRRIAAVAREAPDDAGRPVAADVDLLPAAAAVEHIAVDEATTAAGSAGCDRLAALIDDVNLGACTQCIYD
jgi:hypothetical protein